MTPAVHPGIKTGEQWHFMHSPAKYDFETAEKIGYEFYDLESRKWTWTMLFPSWRNPPITRGVPASGDFKSYDLDRIGTRAREVYDPQPLRQHPSEGPREKGVRQVARRLRHGGGEQVGILERHRGVPQRHRSRGSPRRDRGAEVCAVVIWPVISRPSRVSSRISTT